MIDIITSFKFRTFFLGLYVRLWRENRGGSAAHYFRGGMTDRRRSKKGKKKGGGWGRSVARYLFSAALLFPLYNPHEAPSFLQRRQELVESPTICFYIFELAKLEKLTYREPAR